MRPLVGYKHQPGAEGNALIGDLADAVPEATDRGLTYTYKLRDGIKFGPPVNRAVTSKDVAYAMNRLANPKDGGQYSFYYTVIKGWQEVADGKATTVSGITTPDDKTIVFNLTKPDRRLQPPHVDAGDGTDPEGSRRLLRGQARRLRPERHLDRPVHDQGLGRHVLVVQRPQAVQRLRRRQRQPHRARPQPELRPVDRPVPEELSGPVPVPGQLERGRHLRAGGRRQARGRAVEPAAEDDPAVRDGSDPEAPPAVERRRPHLVPDDEPDAGTVRRHPRAQGDEPDHGQERAAARRGAVPWSARSQRTSRRP